MRVEHEGQSYIVGFEHKRTENWCSLGERRVTCCAIRYGTGFAVQVRGESVCRPPDQFDRERGRKIALARALDALVLGRGGFDQGWKRSPKDAALRRAFWDAYRSRPRLPGVPKARTGEESFPREGLLEYHQGRP